VKTPAATAELALPDRILAAVARSDSRRPARAADVAVVIGGAEAAFWAALERLIGERRINTAHVQKQGDRAPWLAIWPTGLTARSAAWTSDSHGALFVKPRPDDLFLAYAPRVAATPGNKSAPVQEPKEMENHRKKGQLKTQFVALVAGLGPDRAITLAAAAQKLGCSVESLRHTARTLAEKGEVGETTLESSGRDVHAYHAATPSPAVPEPVAPKAPVLAAAEQGAVALAQPEPRPAPVEPPPQPLYRAGDIRVTEIHPDEAAQIEFALWDDGRLTIAEGDEILLLPAEATKRLALLLGVPGSELPSARAPRMSPLPQLVGAVAEARA